MADLFLSCARADREAAREFTTLLTREDCDEFQGQHLARWFFASPELITVTREGPAMAGVEDATE